MTANYIVCHIERGIVTRTWNLNYTRLTLKLKLYPQFSIYPTLSSRLQQCMFRFGARCGYISDVTIYSLSEATRIEYHMLEHETRLNDEQWNWNLTALLCQIYFWKSYTWAVVFKGSDFWSANVPFLKLCYEFTMWHQQSVILNIHCWCSLNTMINIQLFYCIFHHPL